MKKTISMVANSVLMSVAAIFITTNSLGVNRPETPIELLKKK